MKIHQALAPIDIIQSLLTDDDIAKFLKPRLKGVSYLSRPIPNFDMGDEYLKGEIDIAFEVFMSQMIVLAVTYAELIIEDFYQCLLYANPQRMNSILPPEKGEAAIGLNEILRNPSKEELIKSLVEWAAREISGRKIDKIVENLIKESHLTLTHPIATDLKKLNEERNYIVHEGKIRGVNLDRVHKAFGQILYLLYFLGEVAVKYNVPLLDEVGFLDDFRERLKTS